MNRIKSLYFHFVFFAFVYSCIFNTEILAADTPTKSDTKCWNDVGTFARICYFTDWAVYREGKGKFTPENIDANLCTHILYAFALLDESLDKIAPADSSVDLDKGFYKSVMSAKDNGVKVILSLGGWNESTEKYSKMMGDPQHRANVVSHISSYLKEYNFQGLDVDIEYPNAYQGKVGTGPHDKENYVTFLRDLRKKFDEDYEKGTFSERLTLSVAVGANETILDAGYDVPGIAKVVDWIGVMTYDIHSQDEGRTGLVAPFSVQPGDPEKVLKSNVQSMMTLWLNRGAPANKLVVGFPLYGRTFKLTDKNSTGINAPADGEPKEGCFTKSNTTLAFYEIMDDVLKDKWNAVHCNSLGSYAFQDDQWVGYDDQYDVAVKAEYVKLNCFFGGMVWALDLDCFQSDCPGGPYPLLRTLNDVLTGKSSYENVKNIT